MESKKVIIDYDEYQELLNTVSKYRSKQNTLCIELKEYGFVKLYKFNLTENTKINEVLSSQLKNVVESNELTRQLTYDLSLKLAKDMADFEMHKSQYKDCKKDTTPIKLNVSQRISFLFTGKLPS